jgi:predicted alpha/beta hydrolase
VRVDEVTTRKVDAPAPVLGVVPAGQYRIKVRAVQQDDPSAPVAVLAPAMGVPAGYYRPFVAELHRLGMTVVSFDVRGQGENKPRAQRGVHFGYQDFVNDLDAVLDLVESVLPRAPRFILGHSLGGQIALLHTAANPGRIRGAALIATGSVWYRGYPGLAKYYYSLLGTQTIALASTLLGYWPGYVFGGKQATGLMRDWARQARTGRWRLSGSDLDYDSALADVTTPLLTVTVDNDELAPKSSMNDLVKHSTRAERTSRHYTADDAGGPVDHFKWTRSSAEMAAWIQDWMHGVLAR